MTMHRLNTANAADLFEGRRPEERTLTDYCRTPFSFGLVLLIPVIIMVWAFVNVVQARPMLHILKPDSLTVLEVTGR